MTTLVDLLTLRIAERLLEHERATGRVELELTEPDLDLVRQAFGTRDPYPNPLHPGTLGHLEGIPVRVDPGAGPLLGVPARCSVCGRPATTSVLTLEAWLDGDGVDGTAWTGAPRCADHDGNDPGPLGR